MAKEKKRGFGSPTLPPLDTLPSAAPTLTILSSHLPPLPLLTPFLAFIHTPLLRSSFLSTSSMSLKRVLVMRVMLACAAESLRVCIDCGFTIASAVTDGHELVYTLTHAHVCSVEDEEGAGGASERHRSESGHCPRMAPGMTRWRAWRSGTAACA